MFSVIGHWWPAAKHSRCVNLLWVHMSGMGWMQQHSQLWTGRFMHFNHCLASVSIRLCCGEYRDHALQSPVNMMWQFNQPITVLDCIQWEEEQWHKDPLEFCKTELKNSGRFALIIWPSSSAGVHCLFPMTVFILKRLCQQGDVSWPLGMSKVTFPHGHNSSLWPLTSNACPETKHTITLIPQCC